MIWPITARYVCNTDPFQDLDRMRNAVDRWFSSYPALNLWTGADEAVVLVQIPGVDPKDVSLTLAGNVLTIEGKRDPEPTGGGVVHRAERDTGTFSRSIRLPFETDSEKVTAAAEHGILRITLPRSEASKPRKITINQEKR